MNATCKVFPNVRLGEAAELDDFLVLGCPPAGAGPGHLALTVGKGARLRSHSVFYAGTRIGDDFQCGHGALVREHCEIGDGCSVGSGTVVEFRVRMGDRVRIHSNCFIPEYSVLEDECWLGPNVVLTNAPYPGSRRAKETLQGVLVGSRARIGANVTVLPGVRIGAGALVGAGSVVTRDVPPGRVAVGCPARLVGLVKDLKCRDTGLPAYAEDPS